MVDVVDAATRSRMMSGIRGKNTKPELTIRKALHGLGFRYTLHHSGLPGKPDIVFPKRRAVIMVNGCFWHRHHCHLFKLPSTRVEFWEQKLTRNRTKDAEVRVALEQQGWRRLTIWECALKGRSRLPLDNVISAVSGWLTDGTDNLELEGLDCGVN